jgi:hypothetical protein
MPVSGLFGAGTYDFGLLVPPAARAVIVFSCVGSAGTNYMGQLAIIGTNGVSAVCASAHVQNGINTFSGSGWFVINGYVM